jgi:hypothetical protein
MMVAGCNVLNETRDMAIVYVAHSVTETVVPPDAPEYTRYGLRLHSRVQAHYVDEPDMVAFVRAKTRYVTDENTERVRAKSTGEREIVCHLTPNNVSKNRYNITAPVPWTDKDTNPLLPLIPFYQPRPTRRNSRA